jgi:cyclic lactone autoinducer peptide
MTRNDEVGKEVFEMMKIKGVLLKMTGAIAALALFMGIASSQAACALWFHQPAIPKEMKRFMRERS